MLRTRALLIASFITAIAIVVGAQHFDALSAAPSARGGQERDRAKVPDRYKWNLGDLYPTDDAWRAAKDRLVAEIPKISAFKGTLGSSPAQLANALDETNHLTKDLQRIVAYAGLISDQDTRVAKYQGMQQEMQQVGASFGEQVAFIEPEILKIDKATLDRWAAAEPRLNTYRHYLDDIQRRRPHTLSDAEERLLALSSVATASPQNTFSIFSNADFPHPTVTLSDGKAVKLDSSTFERFRAVANRDDRQRVMSAFFGAIGEYRGTFGSTLDGQVQANVFYAKARHYGSALEAALDGSNIPVSVYTKLVEGINEGLPTFHRYLQLRKQDAAATKRYLAFLSAGGSKYPIDLLKDAGVDMTTNEPLQLTLKKMNRVMDEMEALLSKR